MNSLACCGRSVIGWAVALALYGCSAAAPPPAPAVRAVKLVTVQEQGGRALTFLGTVRQRQRADLAFESAGRLLELPVDIGATFKAGQVLAALDRQPARLRVQQAQASADAASAQAVEREANYLRQQRLYAGGNVAQSVVEAARAGRQQAIAERSRYQAELALAQRDLQRSQLVAPFNGQVVARHADRYGQVAPGQVVLELESTSEPQVVVALPVAQAQQLRPGDTALAYSSAAPQAALGLVLEGVSPRADNGLVQTCLFRLREPSARLASGENVRLVLAPPIDRRLSVPVQALAMGGDSATATVFVYQPSTGRVTARPVRLSDISQGRGYIASGLDAGQQVVAAGAAFLLDGQAVSVLEPTTRLPEAPL